MNRENKRGGTQKMIDESSVNDDRKMHAVTTSSCRMMMMMICKGQTRPTKFFPADKLCF